MKNHVCILAAIAALSASAVPMATEHYVDVATNNVYAAATNAPYLIKSKVANIPTVDVLEFNVCRVGESNRVEWVKPLVSWVGQLIDDGLFDNITAANRYTDSAIAEIPSWAKEENPPAETDPTVPSWAKSTNPPTETDPTVPAWAKAVNPPIETDPTVPAWAKAAHAPVTSLEPATNYTDSVASATRTIVATWENFLDGSNVIFAVTNYVSGSYNLDDAKFRIRELKDGSYQEIYNSRDEIVLHIEDFSNKYVRVALDAIVDAVEARLASKADKDWGKYTSAGGEAPANTVYMTAPNTVFAGGLEYERVAVGEGMICVLTTHGAPVWTQGDEGTFKFQDDGGTNYFGFAKTDSYTIGASTDGISVNNGLVTMTYNIAMSGRPCVWYKSDLRSNAPWEQLNLPDGSPVVGATYAVAWEQNPPAETQICYVNVGNAPQGFFRATVEVTGEAKFMTNMPADLSSGIICTNTTLNVNGVIKPTFNGSDVIWNWSTK